MYKRTTEVEGTLINEWLFPKTTVILISGKAGVGKTTAAECIQNYLHNEVTGYSYITHFATGVKKVAYLMGWDGQKNEKGRQLLQKVGNLGRWYRENTWIDFMMVHLREVVPEELLDVIVVDDWRFPNEANYFLKNERFKVFTISIKASSEKFSIRGTKERKDISETSLENYRDFNYIVWNENSMEVFERDVVNVLLDIIKESKQGGKL